MHVSTEEDLKFLKRMGDHQNLKSSEVNVLIEEYRENGDLSIRNKIILSHQRLVILLISRYSTDKIPADELYSLGTIAIIRALKTFDPKKGKFVTHAYIRIKNEILVYIRDTRSTVRIPVTAQKKINAGGCTYALTQGTSIDQSFHNSELGEDFLNIKDKEALRLFELFEVMHDLSKIDGCLTEREEIIIRMRFWEEKTLKEVSQVFGVSRERIRQIQNAATKKMRKKLLWKEGQVSPMLQGRYA